MQRNLSHEAHLWYTLTSPDFFEQAKFPLQTARDLFINCLQADPLASNYAPMPSLATELDELLHTHSHAKLALQHGEWSGVIAWQGKLERLPRSFGERNLAWMGGSADLFMQSLEAADSIASSIWVALVMSKMYSSEKYSDRTADWHFEIPSDMGYQGGGIAVYQEPEIFPTLPTQIPEYAPDTSISCKTGDIVPWTGVWVPSTGMGTAALAFARKDLQVMQAAYEIASVDEDGYPTFKVVDCTWHPVKPTGRMIGHPVLLQLKHDAATAPGRCESGVRCPREGYWFTPAQENSRRLFKLGQTMPRLGTDYGITIWQWDLNQA